MHVCTGLLAAMQKLINGKPETFVECHIQERVNTGAGIRHVVRIEAVLANVLW